MKGKRVFTSNEITELKKLIEEKIIASPEKQKGIRNKIRNLKFYYSDFRDDKPGYTIKDLENLIQSGEIKVIGENELSRSIPRNEEEILKDKEESPIEVLPYNDSKRNPKDTFTEERDINFESILESFNMNKFNPETHTEKEIEDCPGNYILCLKENAKLPVRDHMIVFEKFDGLEVLYTGIAGKSLRKRDYKQHFIGNNAGRSTLRKSLGVLFGYKLIPRDKNPLTGKTKFNEEDEKLLSKWMKKNLIMFYYPTGNYDTLESKLIKHFNPPLNLSLNKSNTNKEFRKYLSSLRNKRED